MRKLTLALSLLLALIATPQPAHASDGASVHAILITASKEKKAADPKLALYEATLQRNLPESSFHYVAEGRASVTGKGGRATISLGAGHSVEVEAGGKDGDGISLRVQWLHGKTVVMNNSVTIRPGVPFVFLRRPSDDGDVPLVVIIAQ